VASADAGPLARGHPGVRAGAPASHAAVAWDLAMTSPAAPAPAPMKLHTRSQPGIPVPAGMRSVMCRGGEELDHLVERAQPQRGPDGQDHQSAAVIRASCGAVSMTRQAGVRDPGPH
jgi:hypothetical protein